MRIVLNTIALEPNRWTPDKTPARPLTDLLPAIAGAGFKTVDLWGYHVNRLSDSELATVKHALFRMKLDVCRISSYMTAECTSEGADPSQVIDRYLALAGAFGAKSLRIFFGMPKGYADFDEAWWKTTVDIVTELCDKAGKAGVSVAAETHGNTACDCLEGCLEMRKRMNGRVGLVYQFMSRNNEENHAHVRALAGAMEAFHLQNRDPETRTFTPLADGPIDYENLLATAKSAGFDGDLVIEFVEGCTADPFDLRAVLEAARRDAAWAREIWER